MSDGEPGECSQHIELDHLTTCGSFPPLLVNASQNLRVTHSAFRGNATPWTGRAHMKYRGTASDQIVLRNEQPGNEHLEFAHREFTDDRDFAFLRYAKNLQFHDRFVDNFNDDGAECGPKLRSHTIFIHQTAANSGQSVQTEWPDPLRAADQDAPDIGALPLGVVPWGVGVDGRIPLFGGAREKQ